jgi:threonine/homoserine/homoserine lactone efflux protein
MVIFGRGVGQGHRAAFCTVLGMTLLAGMVQLPLLVLGIASLLYASPVAFIVLRWAGAIYLVWLGVASFGQASTFRPGRLTCPVPPLGRPYARA